MQSTPAMQFTGRRLLTALAMAAVLSAGVKFTSNQTILAGTPVAQLTSTAVNHVWRINSSHSSGSTYIGNSTIGYTTTAIAHNATAAAVLAALQTIPVLKGNVSVSGAFNSGTCDITCINELAGLPQVVLEAFSSTLAGGSIAFTNQTLGVANDRWIAADLTKITDPTTGPSVSTSTGGTFPVGTYLAQMAWVNSNGETLPSYPTSIIIPDSTNDRMVFAAINAAGTPDDATAIRYYLNGTFVAEVAVASGAIAALNLDALPTTGATKVPNEVNTALIYTDGRQLPKALAGYDMKTGPDGKITLGSSTSSEHGTREIDGTIQYSGVYKLSDLPGMTAAILAAMGGKLIKGSFSDTTTALVHFPY